MAIPETLAALSVPISGLKPYSRNARQGDVGLIVSSLERLGQFRPIVVNARTSEVLAGNHTLAAARELGWAEIAATFVDVDEDTAARINLVDNRANDAASYDEHALAELLQSLPDLDGTGFDGDALDQLLSDLGAGGEPGRDTDPIDPPAEPDTRIGDLYVLGSHRLLCGDALVEDHVARLLDGDLAHLVFTDPPYGVDYSGGTKLREGLAGDQRGTSIYADVVPALLEASDAEAAVYLWHAGAVGMPVHAALAESGYEVRAQIVWVKNQAQFGALGAQYKQKHEPCFYAFRKGSPPRWYGPANEVTVWEADRARANDYHPTQKPIELAERAMGNSSLTGHIVLDLFGGSGSTMIAAENRGRRAYLMELDPGYCDVIVDRWERHTGKTAERTRDGETVEAHA